MKTFLRLLSVLAAAYLSFFRLSDRHPPPNVPARGISAYAAVSDLASTSSGCALDPNFEPVFHTARGQVQWVFHDLALAAGNDPDSYSIELMQDRRGYRAINAMTCTASRVIWLSVTAWDRLSDNEPALALLLAHELAHADHRNPALLKNDPMTDAERHLLGQLTLRQLEEIAADHRAADLMVLAGYSIAEINQASRFILADGGALAFSGATQTHPAGRDRANLMTFYLGRKMLTQFSR
ncbi:hypothetical protein FUA23_15995 [Neolewinella aurantiaca]|uniref:Peptidase M48-like protein n=1 Tax=Neolewinella aurantiaca TaxID=2602767 RepID=A0A5C7FEZ9_9BACT|nr:hypothetical protein [Neolewinella aurantiaca]TXF88141.1 hypothetical protein FUA23_15995 [Neolewinella aurantiaca]